MIFEKPPSIVTAFGILSASGPSAVHCFWVISCKSFHSPWRKQIKKGWKPFFCSVSSIKLIHLNALCNSDNANLTPNFPILLTAMLWGNCERRIQEMQNCCLSPFLTWAPLCLLPHSLPCSISLSLFLSLCLNSHWNVKCSSCLQVKEAPWWEQNALLTWRPRLVLFSLSGLSHPTFSADVVWGSTGCKGMGFFSPGPVNRLAQKYCSLSQTLARAYTERDCC